MSRLYDRANKNDAGANTITRLPSRTPQNDHPWNANPNGAAARTRGLRSETQRCKRHDSRTGATNSALQDSSKSHFCDNPNGTATFSTCGRSRTLSNACTQTYPPTPLNNGNPFGNIRRGSNNVWRPLVSASSKFAPTTLTSQLARPCAAVHRIHEFTKLLCPTKPKPRIATRVV